MAAQTRETNPTISTRFEPDTLARLDAIAAQQKRSRSDIIKEAVNGYIDSMAWFEREVRKGLDDLEAGRAVSHEEVVQGLRELGLDVG